MELRKVLSICKPQNRFERHTIVWTLFIFANTALFSVGQPRGRFIEFLADYTLSLPIIFFITYLTVYWLIPKLLLKKKFVIFTILFMLLLLISGILEHYKTQVILLPLIKPELISVFTFNFFSISRGAFFILIPTIFFISVKYAREWYNMKVLKTEEERKQLRNELKYLKAQVHPHFLLVTLSNLEAIARKDPVKAAPGIEKISEILNFILYECNFPRIRVNKEIEQIRSFIDLQELNFSKKTEINYSVIGPTIEVTIAPLLIFTIVEFFFKNSRDDNEAESKLNIFVEIFHNIFNFRMESENFHIGESDFENDTGIINLTKRLNILYKNKSELSFRNSDNKTMVQLTLTYI